MPKQEKTLEKPAIDIRPVTPKWREPESDDSSSSVKPVGSISDGGLD